MINVNREPKTPVQMVLVDLKEYISALHAGWLYTNLLHTRLFFFDFWTFNHFGSGFFLLLICQFAAPRCKWISVLVVLLLYEITEILFVYYSLNVFHPETIKDQITDIGVGLAGALIASLLFNLHFSSKHPGFPYMKVAKFISAATAAYFFTGFYHYQLAPDCLNNDNFSFFELSIWLAANLIVIEIFTKLRKQNHNILKALVFSVFAYFAFSFLICNFAGSIIGIRDLTLGSRIMLFETGGLFYPAAYLCPPLLLLVCMWASESIFRKAIAAMPANAPPAKAISTAFAFYFLFILSGYALSQSLAGRKWILDMPDTSAEAPAELLPGDIIVRTNNRFYPGSAWMPQGRYVGHVAIVMNHVASTNFDSMMQKAIVIESVVYDQQEKRYLTDRSRQLRYVFAARSFGEKYKGCRYVLHMDLTNNQRIKFCNWIKQQKNPGYSFIAVKNENYFFNRFFRKVFPVTRKYNCAAFTWTAYAEALDVNIDSNGGLFVFPNDIIVNQIFNKQGARYCY